MNNLKRISLMTGIFLTVALVGSAVEAGVIRINGTVTGSETVTPFPNPAEGIYVNGSAVSTDTALGPFTLFYSLPVDFAFANTPPGNAGGSRLIVGVAANAKPEKNSNCSNLGRVFLVFILALVPSLGLEPRPGPC